MKHIAAFLVACLLVTAPTVIGQDHPPPMMITLIRLIAEPHRFEDKQVTIRGFLLASVPPHDIAAYFLCLNREDAENQLGNDVLLVPNKEMKENPAKFNRMYIEVTGTVKLALAEHGDYIVAIKDIQKCTVWSDPSRPILSEHVVPKAQ
jgi:hypothetical protein